MSIPVVVIEVISAGVVTSSAMKFNWEKKILLRIFSIVKIKDILDYVKVMVTLVKIYVIVLQFTCRVL